MLPLKVRGPIRALLATRLRQLAEAMAGAGPASDSTLAELAWLVGEAGAMLDPYAVSSLDVIRREDAARRHARVSVWDGECEADATTDDGLCADHAAEQAREAADPQADLDAHADGNHGAG